MTYFLPRLSSDIKADAIVNSDNSIMVYFGVFISLSIFLISCYFVGKRLTRKMDNDTISFFDIILSATIPAILCVGSAWIFDIIVEISK